MKRLLLIGCCLLAVFAGCKSKPYQYRNAAGTIIKTDVKPDWWGDQNSYVAGVVDEKATKEMIAFRQSMQQAEQTSQSQANRYKDVQPTPDATKEREAQIKNQFDPWYGNHLPLTRYVKRKMNDPASFEHVETRYADKGSYVYLEMDFRGKNAMNAMVLQTVTAKATLDGELIEVGMK